MIDTEKRAETSFCTDKDKKIYAMVTTKDKKFLFTGDGKTGVLEKWSIQNKVLSDSYGPVLNDVGIRKLYITENNKYLFIGGMQGHCVVFNVEEGQITKKIENRFKSGVFAMIETHNNQYMMISDFEGNLKKISIQKKII